MTASLSAVASALPGAETRGVDVDLVDTTHDSRQVGPGWLFCAIVGTRSDGHDHIPDAVARGAAAVLVERWVDTTVPQIAVPSVRAAAGIAASVVHGVPSDDLVVIGITGTNGKTTTAYLLEGALAAAGQGVGVIGTIETRIHGAPQAGVRTTPEGTDLQRLLRTMHTRGVDAVAMEVSSHGLDLHRVDGTRFRVAVYTNLSQDHLDWHGSMEAYLAAKARLFTPELSQHGVVHLDGPWADRLLESATIPVTTFGRGAGDIRIIDEGSDVDGGWARLDLPDGPLEVRTSLPGRYNLTNAVTAVVAAMEAGIDPRVAAAGVAGCPGAPGRLERIELGQPTTVLVDYAHSPDAVEQLVDTVRSLLPPEGRMVLVLGCGGDRDREKRPHMGAAAVRAHHTVFTSDNPRSEDPDVIIAAMVDGAEAAQAAGAPGSFEVEPDRRAAIAAALGVAGADDVVVIAGKGHETGQELADRTVPFDDREVARELIRAAGDDQEPDATSGGTG